MNVLIDLRPLRPPVSGVARYCLHLFNALAELNGRISLHGLVQGHDEVLGELSENGTFERPLEWVRPVVVRNALVDFVPGFDRALGLAGYDVVHETYSARLATGGRRNMVATVHDVIPIDAPEFYSSRIVRSVRRNLKHQVSDARAVICVSQYTRDRVLRLTDCDPGKLHVIGCGVSELEAASEPEAFAVGDLPLSEHDEYCLLLGNVEDRKNLALVLRNWPRVRMQHPSIKLVIAGAVNHRTSLASQVRDHPAGVIFAGAVSNAVKWALLRKARMLLFPSFYEGFGIPALEAYYAGFPVLLSRGSALTELMWDERQGFDPRSDAEFTACVLAALERPAWLDAATTRGQAWARTQTWTKVAAEVAAVYRNVCDDR